MAESTDVQRRAASASAEFSASRFWGVRLLSGIAVVVAALVLQYWIVPKLGIYDTRLIVLSLLFATLAVSLNLINGITGQFSIGHAAFFLVGAYTAGKLTMSFYAGQTLAGPAWLLLMVVVGAVAAGIAGFVVGLPSLRLRGDYLAIATLGFGEIARIIVLNQGGGSSSFFGLDLGGSFGMNVSPKLTEISYVGLLLIFTILVSRNMLKTAHGLAFLSVREDEVAAEASGVNTTKTKVTAFVIGAGLAGMAGALFAHYEGFIAPGYFDMNASFLILTMVVIGGTGSITGAAVAGLSLTLLQEALRKLDSIAAIDLIAYILAAILITLAVGRTRSHRLLPARGGVHAALLGFGLVGCLVALFAAYMNLRSGVSPVIKTCIVLIIVGAVAALLLTRQGRSSLPSFGLVAASFAAVILLRAPIALMLHNVPFIESALKDTQYSPSNLRMAAFAFALVVVMLTRPQGLFGHLEFNWGSVGKSLGLGRTRSAA